MSNTLVSDDLSINDSRLVEEALRRLDARAAPGAPGRDALRGVLIDQVRRGRRDMFGLVRAGRRAMDGDR